MQNASNNCCILACDCIIALTQLRLLNLYKALALVMHSVLNQKLTKSAVIETILGMQALANRFGQDCADDLLVAKFSEDHPLI